MPCPRNDPAHPATAVTTEGSRNSRRFRIDHAQSSALDRGRGELDLRSGVVRAPPRPLNGIPLCRLRSCTSSGVDRWDLLYSAERMVRRMRQWRLGGILVLALASTADAVVLN